MQHDPERVEEAVLAVLSLTMHQDGPGMRAWKGLDWDALNRLYERGLIADPRNKNKSVMFTDEGAQEARAAADRVFGRR
jgi:hypothetical protein